MLAAEALSPSEAYATAALFALSLHETLAEASVAPGVTPDAGGAAADVAAHGASDAAAHPSGATAGVWHAGGLAQRVFADLGVPSRAWAALEQLSAADAAHHAPALLAALNCRAPGAALEQPSLADADEGDDATAATAQPQGSAGAPEPKTYYGFRLSELVPVPAPAAVTTSAAPSLLSAQPTADTLSAAAASEGASAPRAAPPPRAPQRRAAAALARPAVWALLCACVGGVAGDVAGRHPWYDARARVALRRVARHLRLPWRDVARLECALAAALLAPTEAPRLHRTLLAGGDVAAAHAADAHAAPPLQRGIARARMSLPQRAAVAGAALLGGGLFALSAGLAAPAIATGAAAALMAGGSSSAAAAAAAAAAASSPAAAAAAAAAGGTLGGAATARRMHTRVAGLTDAAFVPICSHADAIAMVDRPPRLAVTLCISGWLDSLDDVARPWADVASSGGGSSDAVALRWEPDVLLALGSALHAFLKQALVQRCLQEGLAQTALASLLASLAAPLALNTAASVVDNAWSVALARADKAGVLLAGVLAARRWAGGRPVTLLACSVGARVAFRALRELARRGAAGVVESAVLVGAPVAAKPRHWAAARSVVAGRLVNVYSANDLVLGVLYRAGHLAAPAGLRPVGAVATAGGPSAAADVAGVPVCACAGVEDVNLSAVVAGHTAYPALLPELLALLRLRAQDDDA